MPACPAFARVHRSNCTLFWASHRTAGVLFSVCLACGSQPSRVACPLGDTAVLCYRIPSIFPLVYYMLPAGDDGAKNLRRTYVPGIISFICIISYHMCSYDTLLERVTWYSCPRGYSSRSTRSQREHGSGRDLSLLLYSVPGISCTSRHLKLL